MNNSLVIWKCIGLENINFLFYTKASARKSMEEKRLGNNFGENLISQDPPKHLMFVYFFLME